MTLLSIHCILYAIILFDCLLFQEIYKRPRRWTESIIIHCLIISSIGFLYIFPFYTWLSLIIMHICVCTCVCTIYRFLLAMSALRIDNKRELCIRDRENVGLFLYIRRWRRRRRRKRTFCCCCCSRVCLLYYSPYILCAAPEHSRFSLILSSVPLCIRVCVSLLWTSVLLPWPERYRVHITQSYIDIQTQHEVADTVVQRRCGNSTYIIHINKQCW